MKNIYGASSQQSAVSSKNIRTAHGLLLTVLLVFSSGCASSARYDLTAIPAYDMTAATEAWSIIQSVETARAEFIQELMGRIYLGQKPNDAEIAEINRSMDQVIYWKAAAEIQIFYADYEGARKNAAKAMVVLARMRALLKPMKEVKPAQEI